MYIAIVDDQASMGILMKEFVGGEDREVSLFLSGNETIDALKAGKIPDVMLIDVYMPDMGGIELTRILKNQYPDIEIIIQTVCDREDTIIEGIKAGASGYLLKGCSSDEILLAIKTVMGGAPT